jgi:hypothetical protein
MFDGRDASAKSILIPSGSDDARKLIVKVIQAEPQDPEVQARIRAEKIANELAILVAHEHRRAKEEQAKREAAEATASQLALIVAHEHADLERERIARERAEAEARDLSALAFEARSTRAPRRRFVA